MQAEEYKIYSATGMVNGKVTYRIYVTASDINTAWALAKAYPESVHLRVDWSMPRRVRTIESGRVIIGPRVA